MEQDRDKPAHLFGLQLNAAGIAWALRFARLMGWVLVLNAFLLAAEALIGYLYIRLDQGYEATTFEDRYYVFFFPYLLFVTVAFSAGQLWHYVRVGRKLQDSISQEDEALFNDSFRSLYKNAVYGIIATIIYIVMDGFAVYFLLKQYAAM